MLESPTCTIGDSAVTNLLPARRNSLLLSKATALTIEYRVAIVKKKVPEIGKKRSDFFPLRNPASVRTSHCDLRSDLSDRSDTFDRPGWGTISVHYGDANPCECASLAWPKVGLGTCFFPFSQSESHREKPGSCDPSAVIVKVRGAGRWAANEASQSTRSQIFHKLCSKSQLWRIIVLQVSIADIAKT